MRPPPAVGLLSLAVVADAGSLISLSRVHHLPLLRRLLSTAATAAQICSGALDRGDFAGQEAFDGAFQPGWLRRHATDLTGWQARMPGEDEGEASSMRRAAQHATAPLIYR